jgi:hypothetical protein
MSVIRTMPGALDALKYRLAINAIAACYPPCVSPLHSFDSSMLSARVLGIGRLLRWGITRRT